jgi:hypothetical protein
MCVILVESLAKFIEQGRSPVISWNISGLRPLEHIFTLSSTNIMHLTHTFRLKFRVVLLKILTNHVL